MDDRLDEVLQRLQAIEHRLAALESRGPSAPPPPPPRTAPSNRPCAFAGDERRIVDLLVSLTADHVEDRLRALMREEERRRERERDRDRGRERERHDPPERR